jgi:hypothetical protein
MRVALPAKTPNAELSGPGKAKAAVAALGQQDVGLAASRHHRDVSLADVEVLEVERQPMPNGSFTSMLARYALTVELAGRDRRETGDAEEAPGAPASPGSEAASEK